MLVEGEGAVVDGGKLPMSVGQNGTGVLTIRHGGSVTVGNADPFIYPWCLVIGNHPKSTGTVEVQHASLLAHGQVIVGRKSTGTLNVDEGGLVVAEDMAIGWAPTIQTGTTTNEGIGAVTVKGRNARLIVDNLLEVQHMGIGSFTVADHGFASAGVGILVNGAMSISDALVETTAFTINGTLTGGGTVIAAQGTSNVGQITAEVKLILVGDIDNTGTITVAAGGDLQCFGALTDDGGTISLKANSKASLEAVESGQQITFSGTNGTLVLRSPGTFSGSVSGFAATDKLVLDAKVDHVVYDVATGVLTATAGPRNAMVAQLRMIGPYSANSFQLASGFPSVVTI